MVKKTKIIFILTVLGPGGAEKVVSTIANNLPRIKYEPKVILFNNKEYSEMLLPDVEVLETHTERIRHSLLPILKILRKEKPDIVFASFGELNAYLSLFIKLFPKTKFIARETNVVSKHVIRPEIKFFYKFYNNYHKIVCQSDDMKEDLLKNFHIQETKLLKINNPVDFQKIDEKLTGQNKPESYTESMKHVVAVGNLSARKGFDLLLEVFVHLKDQKIMLHILGDGKDKELLYKLKNQLQLQNVRFYGAVSNPYPYLKFADLFVLSSRHEGFPNVLLEAGACGTYALANDCPGGIREIILPGINGEILDIENDEVFAEKIKETLFQETHPEKIRKAIESRFSKEIILEKYEALFESIKNE